MEDKLGITGLFNENAQRTHSETVTRTLGLFGTGYSTHVWSVSRGEELLQPGLAMTLREFELARKGQSESINRELEMLRCYAEQS
jgi:hypothetical protein